MFLAREVAGGAVDPANCSPRPGLWLLHSEIREPLPGEPAGTFHSSLKRQDSVGLGAARPAHGPRAGGYLGLLSPGLPPPLPRSHLRSAPFALIFFFFFFPLLSFLPFRSSFLLACLFIYFRASLIYLFLAKRRLTSSWNHWPIFN